MGSAGFHKRAAWVGIELMMLDVLRCSRRWGVVLGLCACASLSTHAASPTDTCDTTEQQAAPCPPTSNPLTRLKRAKPTEHENVAPSDDAPLASPHVEPKPSASPLGKLKTNAVRQNLPAAKPESASEDTVDPAAKPKSGLAGLTKRRSDNEETAAPEKPVTTTPKPSGLKALKMPSRPTASTTPGADSGDTAAFSPLLGNDEPPKPDETSDAAASVDHSSDHSSDQTSPPEPASASQTSDLLGNTPASEPGLLGGMNNDESPPTVAETPETVPPSQAETSTDTPAAQPKDTAQSTSVFADVGLPPAEPAPATAPTEPSNPAPITPSFAANYAKVTMINTQNGDNHRVDLTLVAPNRWEADVEFDVEESGDLGAFMFEAHSRDGKTVDLGLLKLPSHDVYYAGIGYRDGQAFERPDMNVGGVLFGIPKPGKGKFHVVFDDIKRFYTCTRN
jgi:hypothetical protein